MASKAMDQRKRPVSARKTNRPTPYWIDGGKTAAAEYRARNLGRHMRVQPRGLEPRGPDSRLPGGLACPGCRFMTEGVRPMMRVFTIDEAAEYLKVSRTTVTRRIADGRIKCVRTGRYGGRVLISEWALIQFLLGEESSGDEGDDLSVRI